MGNRHHVRSRAAKVAALILGVLALTAAACGGYCLPLPPTAAPTLPPGTSLQPALSFPAQSATTRGFFDCSAGWAFRPVVDIEVTALGYYDDGRDGLLNAHRSAIFDAVTRQAIAQATIRPQSALAGLFRWEPVGPVVLQAGREYVMVSSREGPFDPEIVDPKNASTTPELRYLGYRETPVGRPAWGCPDRTSTVVRLSGNFLYRRAPALDPSVQ